MTSVSGLLPFANLTTTFTPSFSCTRSWVWSSQRENATTLYQHIGAYPSFFYDDCVPAGYNVTATPGGSGGTFNAPGVCPYRYTTATVIPTQGTGSMQRPEITACCFSDFTYVDKLAACTSTYKFSSRALSLENLSEQPTATVSVNQGVKVAEAVVFIKYEEFVTYYVNNLNGGSESPSLSKGAIAGIVIGAVFGVAILAGFLFFLLRRAKAGNGLGRKNHGMKDNTIHQGDATAVSPFEMESSEIKPPIELPGSHSSVYMPNGSSIQETGGIPVQQEYLDPDAAILPSNVSPASDHNFVHRATNPARPI